MAKWYVNNRGPIPVYKLANSRYSVRRVIDPSGLTRNEKRWALYCDRQRVWELQAMPDPQGAIAQAENWLMEHEIIRRYRQ